MKRILFTLLLVFTCVASVLTQDKMAIIEFAKKKHDFGTINIAKDTVVYATFIFSNRGTYPLVIHKVTPSCGCTAVSEWTKAPVKQGDNGFIKVTFNTKGINGKFSKSIYVKSNATEDVIILRIEGNVINKKQNSFFDWFH